MSEKGKRDYARDKELSNVFSVKVRKSTGMVEALDKMIADTGITRNAYIIETVCARLRAEGYLTEESKT